MLGSGHLDDLLGRLDRSWFHVIMLECMVILSGVISIPPGHFCNVGTNVHTMVEIKRGRHGSWGTDGPFLKEGWTNSSTLCQIKISYQINIRLTNWLKPRFSQKLLHPFWGRLDVGWLD